MIYIPKHFTLIELFPRYIVNSVNPDYLWSMLDGSLLKALDDLREYFNTSIYVNYGETQCRGFRDCFVCRDVGGKLSPHRLGKAFDLNVRGCEAEEVREAIIRNRHLFPAIRRMEKGVSWVHIDSLPHYEDGIKLFGV